MNPFPRRCLLPTVVLAMLATSCEQNRETKSFDTQFKWNGKLWRAWYTKTDSVMDPFIITLADGTNPPPGAPEPPILVKDGIVYLPPPDEIVPPGNTAPPRTQRSANAISGYLCILDVAAQDYVRLFDLATASLQASIAVTALPLGLAISKDGRFIYVSLTLPPPCPACCRRASR